MIETFDFVLRARRQEEFMNALEQGMVHDATTVLYTENIFYHLTPVAEL